MRRAAGSIWSRNRRVGPMTRPNRLRNNRPRWLQSPCRRLPPDRLSRGIGYCLDKRKATRRSGLCFWRERLSIAVVAAAPVIPVTVFRAVIVAAIVVATATVIHGRRVYHRRRGRDVHRRRAVIHRRRRHVDRLRSHIDWCRVGTPIEMPTSTRAKATLEIISPAAPTPAISHFFILHLPAARRSKVEYSLALFSAVCASYT